MGAGPGPVRPEPPGLLPPAVETLPEGGGRSGGGWVRVAPGTVGIGIAVTAIAVGCLVVLAAILTALAKARRRSRRRRATGRAACVGAWREATDRLIECGMTVPPAMTANEVADRAEAAVGPAGGAVTLLAPIATAAVFALHEPDDRAVRSAWELEAQLRRRLDDRRGPLRRLAARLDPRPLLAGPAGWRSGPDSPGEE